MTKNHKFVYESPDVEIIDISTEGVLCASSDDFSESYFGEDKFETLF